MITDDQVRACAVLGNLHKLSNLILTTSQARSIAIHYFTGKKAEVWRCLSKAMQLVRTQKSRNPHSELSLLSCAPHRTLGGNTEVHSRVLL